MKSDTKLKFLCPQVRSSWSAASPSVSDRRWLLLRYNSRVGEQVQGLLFGA